MYCKVHFSDKFPVIKFNLNYMIFELEDSFSSGYNCYLQELQNLIDEANQSLEESGTPSHEIMVIVLHREFSGGSIGITLAGGADYESKEITVIRTADNQSFY